MTELTKSLTKLMVSQVDTISLFKKEFINGLHILLNGNYINYDIDNSIYKEDKINISDKTFQKILSNINEKSNKRKINGVYYTPDDVAKYIICNSFINLMIENNKKMHNFNDGLDVLSKMSKTKVDTLLFNKNIIDPTCGSGEFLVNTFILKYDIANKMQLASDKNILTICSTIFGNDIDNISTDITKIRLYFYVAKLLKNKDSLEKLAKILKNNFYHYDFVIQNTSIKKSFDIIIGNPPYVEYNKYPHKTLILNSYGNIYADIIKNSVDILNDGGVLGYIIPLSYTATARMAPIRNYVTLNSSKQFLLSFADRPDCLFDGVHQKLNILIAKKGKKNHQIYTSNYKHWYHSERGKLLNGREVKELSYSFEQFIPKIGNKIEESIFNKIYTEKKNNIYDLQDMEGKNVFLNMRACFWVKAFDFNPGSNEYKKLKYKEKTYKFILCILNSSLFWNYWTIVSDCWHITSKELKTFKVPLQNIDFKIFDELYNELKTKLEETKKYVGTKQVEYEYKHRLCKDIIDKIDDELAKIYKLTEIELKYIKNYAIIYRTGGEKND